MCTNNFIGLHSKVLSVPLSCSCSGMWREDVFSIDPENTSHPSPVCRCVRTVNQPVSQSLQRRSSLLGVLSDSLPWLCMRCWSVLLRESTYSFVLISAPLLFSKLLSYFCIDVKLILHGSLPEILSLTLSLKVFWSLEEWNQNNKLSGQISIFLTAVHLSVIYIIDA